MTSGKKEVKKLLKIDLYTNRVLNSAVKRLNSHNPKKKMNPNKLIRILILLYAKDLTRTVIKQQNLDIERV